MTPAGNQPPSHTADFVVVGAGSAGAALAGRLTESSAATVALLEAGGPDKKAAIHIPAAFSQLFKTELTGTPRTCSPQADVPWLGTATPRGCPTEPPRYREKLIASRR